MLKFVIVLLLVISVLGSEYQQSSNNWTEDTPLQEVLVALGDKNQLRQND